MSDDTQDLDPLFPALEAALTRDGTSMVQLARLAGLDYRTIRRWSDGHQVVADFIAGRSRAVAVEGGPVGGEVRRTWVLERLADRGVPPVEVARAAEAWVEWLAKAPVGAFSSQNQGIYESGVKSSLQTLTAENAGYTVGAMNKGLLQDVASQIRKRSRGRMVLFAVKVPPDFTSRVAAAAASAGISQSDYVRALVELHTEPQPQ